MADIKLDLFPYRLDSPSEVISASVSFVLSGITTSGGFGRLGRGYNKTAILPAAIVLPPTAATANYGFVA